MLRLYNHWRSSSSYRVRIALHYKGLAFEYVALRLLAEDGDQHRPEHHARNAMAQVPVLELELEPGRVVELAQSVAICEYLEERYPDPPLLPRDALARAQVRKCVEIVNSGVQPLQNLSVLAAVTRAGGDAKAFARAANERGVAALEVEARAAGGRFLVGDAVSLADVFLVPQLHSARRFGASLDGCDKLLEIERALLAIEAFAAAHPDRQPDADAVLDERSRS